MQKYRRKVCDFTKGYRRALSFMGLIFVVGIFLGSLYSAMVESDNLIKIKEDATYSISSFSAENLNKVESFLTALKNDIVPLIFVWLAGFSPLLIPFIFVEMIVRGFKMGLSVGILVRLFGGEGLTFAIGSTLLQNLIFVPIFIFLGVYSVQNSMKFRKQRKIHNKIGQRQLIGQQILVLGGVALTAILSGGVESLVVPHILGLI